MQMTDGSHIERIAGTPQRRRYQSALGESLSSLTRLIFGWYGNLRTSRARGDGPGCGFIVIPVELVGRLDPLRIVAAAFVCGMLQSGRLAMQAIVQRFARARDVTNGTEVFL
jgi:ABC-type uncharacterized transport system permease subunit